MLVYNKQIIYQTDMNDLRTGGWLGITFFGNSVATASDPTNQNHKNKSYGPHVHLNERMNEWFNESLDSMEDMRLGGEVRGEMLMQRKSAQVQVQVKAKQVRIQN